MAIPLQPSYDSGIKMKVKCCYCKKEINAFDLRTCVYHGKKKYCHTTCHLENIVKETERGAI